MTSFVVAVVLLVFVVVGLKFFEAQLSGQSGTWPFHARKPLSPPEQVLYFRLVKALPEQVVLAQVGMSRIVGVNRGHNVRAWLNRIDRMSADFVICSRDSAVLAVIEVDDASHLRPARIAADEKKDRALASAGIRVIRWQAKSLPDESAIRATFGDSAGRAPLAKAA